MARHVADWRGAPTLGLVLLGGLGLLGYAVTAIAVAGGAPHYLRDVYLALALGILALYFALVYLGTRQSLAEAQAFHQRAEQLEEALLEALRQLQAGDLVRLAHKSEEFSRQLHVATQAAVQTLAALVQQIQSSSIEVASAGTIVHETATELASGSSQQAAAVVEITATMEELARTAAQIATNAASQAELAAKAEESGNVGAGAVEEALRGVEEVQKRISGIATRADTLGTRSREIYKVLDLINEIAQETHILSLNAGIEAAAAGEHGRRFSVVAEEVRRLAQRSRESVESVRDLLDEFAASIRATIVATEEGGKDAAGVLARARAAAAAIDELRGALSDTASAAREISLATEQQRTASDQVVMTLKEVSQVIQRMADGLRNFSGTADRLNHLALAIQLLTQSFRLDSRRSLKQVSEQWAEDLGRQAGHWEAVEGRLEEMLRREVYLELAYLVDAAGVMVAFSSGADRAGEQERQASIAVGTSLADRPWFQAVARDGKAILTPLYESLLSGEPCFTVAAPVRDNDARLVGVLGLDVNARTWTKI
jgi:methyl-accepting chemotaxis protein